MPGLLGQEVNRWKTK